MATGGGARAKTVQARVLTCGSVHNCRCRRARYLAKAAPSRPACACYPGRFKLSLAGGGQQPHSPSRAARGQSRYYGLLLKVLKYINIMRETKTLN